MPRDPKIKPEQDCDAGPDVHDTLRMSRAELDELVRQSSSPPPPDPGMSIDLSDEAYDEV